MNLKFRGRIRVLLSMALALVAAACAGVERNPVPLDDHAKAQVPNIPRARYWGDEPPAWIEEIAGELEQQRAASGIDEITYLAISGGADYGAFGAGVLNGWTERGDRPEFTLVTGISTGALSAPFAFLGPDYDDELKKVYGGYPTDQIIRPRNPLQILPKASAVDTSPLFELISSFVDEAFLDKIAAEHRKGRRLLVQTTHMDAQRAVIWDMGVIASSGAPNALDLFRRVLLASASVPGLFPPMLIETEIDGETYDEMHVDGGVISNFTILSGWQSDLHDLDVDSDDTTALKDVYVVVNGRIENDPLHIPYQLPDIANRALLTMVRGQAAYDLQDAHRSVTSRDGDFHAAWIEEDFSETYVGPFNQQWMRDLFDYGYRRTINGDLWSSAPPGTEIIGAATGS